MLICIFLLLLAKTHGFCAILEPPSVSFVFFAMARRVPPQAAAEQSSAQMQARVDTFPFCIWLKMFGRHWETLKDSFVKWKLSLVIWLALVSGHPSERTIATERDCWHHNWTRTEPLKKTFLWVNGLDSNKKQIAYVYCNNRREKLKTRTCGLEHLSINGRRLTASQKQSFRETTA